MRLNSSRNCSVCARITFDGMESPFARFTKFVFNFGVESLEQSVELDRLVIFISLAIPFSKHHNQTSSAFYSVFVVRAVFSCCIVVAVAKGNLLNKPAIVSHANFHCSQMLRHPRLAFGWLSVSFFDY